MLKNRKVRVTFEVYMFVLLLFMVKFLSKYLYWLLMIVGQIIKSIASFRFTASCPARKQLWYCYLFRDFYFLAFVALRRFGIFANLRLHVFQKHQLELQYKHISNN